nr:DNA-processing protein DprA [Paenibacillus lemnae]
MIALHETEGIGWKTLDKIYQHGLSPEMVTYRDKEWKEIGLSVEIAQKLSCELAESVDKVCRKLSVWKDGRMGVITIFDAGYPDMLKSSPQAPWVLYTFGDQELLDTPSIAMVGTRVPTAYGRKVASLLTEDLIGLGICVVSGMARGIDSVIHETALRCKGHTIAVLGAGIDVIYPPENRSLYEEISREGLIVSEYPPGTKAHPGFFPQRNRIIAGLTWGTLVVEADARSGSLITADAALEAGRDVYAVPGPITSPKSRGTLDLIKQGAKLVTAGKDIAEEYGWQVKCHHRDEEVHPDGVGAGSGKDNLGLTNDESELYHMLQQGPRTLDELLGESRWNFGLLHSVLLSLIIKKQITQLPGAIYKII